MITRELLKALRSDMDAALAAVAQKHGVAINTGSASFTADAATFKVVVAAIGEKDSSFDGATAQQLKARADWKLAPVFGLKPEWLDTKFRARGEEFTIIGLMPKRTKYPVLARNALGKSMLFTVDTITAQVSR